jgi:hypothetical protein
LTVDVLVKFEPFTVREKPGPPATAWSGEIDVIAGTGLGAATTLSWSFVSKATSWDPTHCPKMKMSKLVGLAWMSKKMSTETIIVENAGSLRCGGAKACTSLGEMVTPISDAGELAVRVNSWQVLN